MKVAYLLALLPVALAAPSALERRADNYNTIKAALQKAATDAQTLKTELDTIPDNGPITPSEQIKLQDDDYAIYQDLVNAGKACNTTSNFSASQSKTGYNDLVALQSITESVLQDLVAHKAAFVSADLISLVCSDLSNLKAQVDSLGPCLASHSTAAYKKKAPALQAQYDSDFSNAESSLGC